MQNHAKIYFACRPPPHVPGGVGSIGQNSTFSEHGHVAYQIKENHDCTNMAAAMFWPHIPIPPTLGMKSIGQNSTFSEHGHVAYQIKWNQHGSNYIARRPPPPPPPHTHTHTHRTLGSKGQNSIFSEQGHVASNMVANILPADTRDGVNRSIFHF